MQKPPSVEHTANGPQTLVVNMSLQSASPLHIQPQGAHENPRPLDMRK